MDYADPEVRNQYQERLILAIRDRMETTGVNAKQLAEALGISPRVIYKRLAGESQFSGYELAVVSKVLGFSVTGLLESTVKPLTFFAPVPADEPFVKDEYLKRLRQAALDGGKEVNKLSYSSDYLPSLHLYKSEILSLLILYFYELPNATGSVQAFNLADYRDKNEDWIQICKFQWKDWQRLESEELWGNKPLKFLSSRIINLLKSRLITYEIVKLILVELKNIVDSLEVDLRLGRKGEDGPALLVYRDWSISTNNFTLVEGPEISTLFLTFNNGLFLHSNQAEATKFFRDYLSSKRKIAAPISGNLAGTRSMIDTMRATILDLAAQAKLLAS